MQRYPFRQKNTQDPKAGETPMGFCPNMKCKFLRIDPQAFYQEFLLNFK